MRSKQKRITSCQGNANGLRLVGRKSRVEDTGEGRQRKKRAKKTENK